MAKSNVWAEIKAVIYWPPSCPTAGSCSRSRRGNHALLFYGPQIKTWIIWLSKVQCLIISEWLFLPASALWGNHCVFVCVLCMCLCVEKESERKRETKRLSMWVSEGKARIKEVWKRNLVSVRASVCFCQSVCCCPSIDAGWLKCLSVSGEQGGGLLEILEASHKLDLHTETLCRWELGVITFSISYLYLFTLTHKVTLGKSISRMPDVNVNVCCLYNIHKCIQ